MNTAVTLLNTPLMHHLGWTLIHFLWQGAVVGAIYAALRYILRGKSPAVRYHLAMGTLAVMAALPVITFLHLSDTPAGIAVNGTLQTLAGATMSGAGHGGSSALSPFEHLKIWLQPLVSWTVPLWLLGVMVMTLRVWRGWRHARDLRETADYIPVPQWHTLVESLCTLLGIRKMVRLAVSASVTVPCVIGWLKPVILIPPSVLSGLTPLQMELILAHELAHIRRQDYLWNLLQVAVDTLLFYHPAVRWVSHQARLEREQCCDDIVVELNGTAIDYARALTELESMRHPHTALLLGADGGQVMERIHRLVGLPASNAAAYWPPLLLTAGLLLAGGLMQFISQKAPLHSPLTAKYTLLGTKQQIEPTPVKISAAAVIQPTRMNTTAWARLAYNQSPKLGDLPHAAFSILPVLAAPSPSNALSSGTAIAATEPAKPTVKPVGGEVISRYVPVYPPMALEQRMEGAATVEFTLTTQGAVTNIKANHVTGSRLFAEAALRAIRKWKFTPVTVAGVPVTQRMSEEFVFRLNHASDKSNGPCTIPLGYHVCTGLR